MTHSNPTGNGILSLNIKDKTALQAAYMPFIRNGGLFVPSPRAFSLGDEVFLLLRLLDDPSRIPVVGKVVWVTPSGAGGRPTGVGIQFNEAESPLRTRIESCLGDALDSERDSHTL